MTILLVPSNAPYFTGLSTDIADNTFSGAKKFLGTRFYTSDTKIWYRILSDGTLSVDSGDTVSLATSDNIIGKVGGNSTSVTVTPVLTVAATYVTGDYVGTSISPMTFSNCARVAGGTGYVTSCMLIDYAKQSIAGELWLFDGLVTPPNDSAAWTLSDADMAKCIGVIPFSTYYASALNSVSFGTPPLAIGFKCGSAVKELYGCFVTRGAPAYASGDLTFRLSILQD